MEGEISRRQFLKAGGLVLVGGFMGFEGCENLLHSGPYIVFEQLDSGCASNGETAQLGGGQGSIRFSGAVATPNPCCDLQAELLTLRCNSTTRCPNTYEVAIVSTPQQGSCIECLGSVTYRGEIRGVESGSYTISITHNGYKVAEAQVQVD